MTNDKKEPQNQDWVDTLRSRHNPYNEYHWGSVIDEITPLISSLLLETEQRVREELEQETFGKEWWQKTSS